MALVKCKQCGNDVASNAAACPKCGSPVPRGTSVLKVSLFVVGGFFSLCFLGTCLGAVGAAKKGASPSAASASDAAPEAAARPEPKPEPKAVAIRTLLAEYADNEVRADSNFKDQIIQTAGIVDDVKKDFTNSVYVTLGTGKQFEIPQIQCFVTDDQVKKAASLSKGTKIGVRGRVQGLMMNVLVQDCEFVDI
ncbi:OB-fold protein [Corallococcus exiguus]|uniref:OB-fold protein n=1 Tax=Corallococcus exiguus TaxID=83462 RepID=UPI00155FC219|nr:zinc-ribbon domain-containing protein [Corallococcus exiguus]NRD53781.1 zinc-ribbon domain-containing protein [Corallococcus exiguus]